MITSNTLFKRRLPALQPGMHTMQGMNGQQLKDKDPELLECTCLLLSKILAKVHECLAHHVSRLP